MRKKILFTAGLAVLVGISVAGAATPERRAPSDMSPLKRIQDLKEQPLIFYVAKGPADACGEGCNTWIAADGKFDSGAPERLRQLLKKLGNRKLPIYFHSPGGLVGSSFEIGRLLRLQKMTAGVGSTIPKACMEGRVDEAACRKLKQAGAELPADLVETGAICASACVYALIGATTRLVAPGANLGVHTPLMIARYSDGRTVTTTGGRTNRALVESGRYVVSMGVDAALMDVVASVSFERNRVLSRDEIVRFKIDTRESSETRWQVVRQNGNRVVAFKSVMQVDDKKEYYFERTFTVACASWPGTLLFRYQRDLPLHLAESIDEVRIDLDDRPLRLEERFAVVSADATESRDGFLPVDRFRKVAALKSIGISEISESASLRFNLSTLGFSDALERVVMSCGPVASTPLAPAMPQFMPKSPSGL